MPKLTKAQTLALFLGSVSPAAIDNIRAVGNSDKVVNRKWDPPGKDLDPVTLGDSSSSTGQCGANSDCQDGSKCAAIFSVSASVDLGCIQELACGALGKFDGDPFFAVCFDDVADGETAVQPDTPEDIAGQLAAVEAIITKTTYKFEDELNLVVSPQLGYLDGWYVEELDVDSGTGTGNWLEYDKPADNRCFLDMQCSSSNPVECCSYFPDANNRRCMDKTLDKITQNHGPMTFTPSCTLQDSDDVTPTSAQDDIAAGALSEANEELENWETKLKTDAKTAAGYDGEDCDQACKDKFDSDWTAAELEAEEWLSSYKEKVKFDDMEDAAKAVFQADLLKWYKAVYNTCAADEKDIECRKAKDIRMDKADEFITDGDTPFNYFTADADARAEFDTAYENSFEAYKSGLVALQVDAAKKWKEDNPIAAGTAGSQCSEPETDEGGNALEAVVGALLKDDCTNNLCCGTSTPGDNSLEKISVCGPREVGAQWTEERDGYVAITGESVTYTHVCQNAMKMLSSVAAAGIAFYYM